MIFNDELYERFELLFTEVDAAQTDSDKKKLIDEEISDFPKLIRLMNRIKKFSKLYRIKKTEKNEARCSYNRDEVEEIFNAYVGKGIETIEKDYTKKELVEMYKAYKNTMPLASMKKADIVCSIRDSMLRMKRAELLESVFMDDD